MTSKELNLIIKKVKKAEEYQRKSDSLLGDVAGIMKSYFDITKPYLKDQSEEVIDFLYEFVKK